MIQYDKKKIVELEQRYSTLVVLKNIDNEPMSSSLLIGTNHYSPSEAFVPPVALIPPVTLIPVFDVNAFLRGPQFILNFFVK